MDINFSVPEFIILGLPSGILKQKKKLKCKIEFIYIEKNVIMSKFLKNNFGTFNKINQIYKFLY